MKKQILLFSVVAVMAASCSKKYNLNTVPENKPPKTVLGAKEVPMLRVPYKIPEIPSEQKQSGTADYNFEPQVPHAQTAPPSQTVAGLGRAVKRHSYKNNSGVYRPFVNVIIDYTYQYGNMRLNSYPIGQNAHIYTCSDEISSLFLVRNDTCILEVKPGQTVYFTNKDSIAYYCGVFTVSANENGCSFGWGYSQLESDSRVKNIENSFDIIKKDDNLVNREKVGGLPGR